MFYSNTEQHSLLMGTHNRGSLPSQGPRVSLPLYPSLTMPLSTHRFLVSCPTVSLTRYLTLVLLFSEGPALPGSQHPVGPGHRGQGVPGAAEEHGAAHPGTTPSPSIHSIVTLLPPSSVPCSIILLHPLLHTVLPFSLSITPLQPLYPSSWYCSSDS